MCKDAKKKLATKLALQGATITPFMTTEKWVDKNGNVYYVDFTPIDWKRAFRGK